MANNINMNGLIWDRKRTRQLARHYCYCYFEQLLFRCEQKLKLMLPKRIVKRR